MKTSTIKFGIRQEELNPNEIVFFEADVNYTKIHFASGRTNTVAFTLKNIENQLNPHKTFCRVHKSYIVNLEYVKAVEETQVLLKNKQKVLLSRRRRKQNLGRLMSVRR